MPAKKEIPGLVPLPENLGAAPGHFVTDSPLIERYRRFGAEQAPMQFEIETTKLARLLIDNDLACHADIKAALVQCIDKLPTRKKG